MKIPYPTGKLSQIERSLVVPGGKTNRLSSSPRTICLGPIPILALDAVAQIPVGEKRLELRLVRIPALNFGALGLHSGEGQDDQLLPLRSSHGFMAMHPVSYAEAIERLREAAWCLA